MIDMLFTDSSTVVKFYTREPGWESVEEYVSNSATIPLALIELSSALIKKCKSGDVTVKHAEQLIRECSERIVLIEQNKHIVDAFKIAASSNLSVYDSLFISVAHNLGLEFLSSDKKQIKIASSLGVKTIEG
jgi:predicted nucleic acid-binding protein